MTGMLEPEQLRPIVPCAGCGEPATPGEVWLHAICDGCFSRWMDDAPDAGTAENLATSDQLAAAKKLGGFLSHFYMQWTNNWIARLRAEAEQ